MKLAKRMLAVVMAVAMIFALSAMAFAAEGTYALTSEMDGETLVVSFSLKNGAGATSDTVTITYDPAVLKIADPDLDIESGKDVVDLKNNVPETVNLLIAAPNAEKAGEIIYGYAFSQALSAEYLKAARGKTVSIDPNDFEFLKIYFTVLDDKAATTITASGSAYAAASVKVAGAAEEADPTPVTPAPVDNTPAEEAPSTPATPTGDQKTGDNMALAAAAGVALLAGAAFIVSKKRK